MSEDSESLKPQSRNTSDDAAASGDVMQTDNGSQTVASGPTNRTQLFAPVDVLPLACFRMFFGAMMLFHVGSYAYENWIEAFYILPTFHFTYPGFGWVKPWPGPGMYIHFGVMGLSAFGIMTGCLYRVSAVIFALCFTHVFLIERITFQNHYYLICLISGIMVFVPAHRMWSVDAWRRPQIRSQTAPQIWLWLLRIQLAIPYVYGAIAKLNYDWLHGMPMRIWLSQRTWIPVIGPWLKEDSAVMFFVWGGMLFDLAIVPALLWRRTRLVAYCVAVAFHIANSVLWNIGIFPWFMIGATLMFFPAGSFRKSLFRRGIRRSDQPGAVEIGEPRQRLTVAVVCLYLTWQLLFPFRHFLYPGNVSWTEEAHQFSWQMMLREKTVGVRFFVHDKQSGKRGILDPKQVLNQRQLSRMGKDPDMILDFIQFVKNHYRDYGDGELEIYVLALASLNGRKPQLLMDPTINYAVVDRVWGTQPWIVPLHEPLRKEGWDLPVDRWEESLGTEIPNHLRSTAQQ